MSTTTSSESTRIGVFSLGNKILFVKVEVTLTMTDEPLNYECQSLLETEAFAS